MQVYGLIGNPVSHSLSPPMQEAGFDAIGWDARYVTFEPTVDDVGRVIAAAETLGLRGLNVTIPYKEAVIEHVDADEQATRVGAANTVDFGRDPATGHNTDVSGAMRALRHHEVTIDDRHAVLLGAGGAARAIAVGLIDAGARLTILNRTESRAAELAARFDGATSSGLDSVSPVLADADILVNATSVGMESDATLVPAESLHAGLTVMDAVYRPLQTRLLQDASRVGATTIDGAWMLLYQGAGAFERWTGEPAPIDAMNVALRSRLA